MALALSLGALIGCFNPKPYPVKDGPDGDGAGDMMATGGSGGGPGGSGGTGSGGTIDSGMGGSGSGGALDSRADEGGSGGDNCLFDEQFTAPTLGLDWNPTAAGQAPTYTITNGKLVITDTALSATPSQPEPGSSWIYKVDQDLGNQIARRADIGRGDFVLDGSFQWASQLDQADRDEGWLGGVALTDSAHHVKAMITAYDPRVRIGSTAGLAVWALYVRPDAGEQMAQEFGDPVDHTARFRIARTGGVVGFTVNDQPVRFLVGGQEVTSTAMTADIAAVAIVTVRLASNVNNTHRFGRLFLDQVRLCRSLP